ncbi:MAG TPA: inorganic diphosphatase [Anaerolineaceae bacterium]|nr:inorganic diphosphatase [Anaerolineaceae bacterium]
MTTLPATDFLGAVVTVQVERPMGSKHPQHGFTYPFNYGYVAGVLGLDGEELDAYVLGVYEPLERFRAECIAVIHRLDDNDDKLVVVPPGKDFTDEQILALTDFQERFFQPVVLR